MSSWEVKVPKVVDHEGRRREIAEAVWRAVARRGMGAATVREIAEEAGFSTGVLAHYFEDKDALIVHALHVSVERAIGRMEERSRGMVGLERLRAVLGEALPLDEERAEELRVWISFWARAVNNPALAAEQNHWYALWRSGVQTLIAGCQREGAIRPNLDAAQEAVALVALVDGISLQATFDPERLTPEEQLATLDRHLSWLAENAQR